MWRIELNFKFHTILCMKRQSSDKHTKMQDISFQPSKASQERKKAWSLIFLLRAHGSRSEGIRRNRDSFCDANVYVKVRVVCVKELKREIFRLLAMSRIKLALFIILLHHTLHWIFHSDRWINKYINKWTIAKGRDPF